MAGQAARRGARQPAHFVASHALHALPGAPARCCSSAAAHLPPPPCAAAHPPQCEGMLPTEKYPDGSKPVQRWSHYQLWWQTIMTKMTPELRRMGWTNLK